MEIEKRNKRYEKTSLLVSLLLLITFAAMVFLTACGKPSETVEETDEIVYIYEKADENVYLYEEVIFAEEIFVKCVGINAEENESGKIVLNLWVSIEQWNTDANINQQYDYPFTSASEKAER